MKLPGETDWLRCTLLLHNTGSAAETVSVFF